MTQVCTLQVSTLQIGVRHRRSAEVGFPQISVGHLAAIQVSARYPYAGEVGMAQVGIREYRFGELHLAQVDARQEQLRLAGMPRAASERIHGGRDIDCTVSRPAGLESAK